MAAAVTVSERDLRTMLGIVSDIRPDLPAEGLPPSLLADLMAQIRCDVIAFGGSTADGRKRGLRSSCRTAARPRL